jgi:hypothetical protein
MEDVEFLFLIIICVMTSRITRQPIFVATRSGHHIGLDVGIHICGQPVPWKVRMSLMKEELVRCAS